MFAYVGGKFRQAKWIGSQMAHTNKYAEVFGGAMWTYINGNISPKEVHYNDYNRFMVNLFACCREYDKFIPLLNNQEAQLNEVFNNYKDDILHVIHNDIPIDMPDFSLGAKYIYVITQCFSGIMSENVKFIDLKGKYRSKYYSFLDRLKKPAIQRKLEKIQTHNLSFDEFIPLVDSEDMTLYLDPPYYKTENLYAFHNFTIDHHEKLAEILNNVKSKWVLSYYEFPEMLEWYPQDKYKWVKKEYKKASMAAKGKKQTIGEELLVIKE